MAYTIVGIINLALGRIAVKRITSLTENSNQAIVSNAVWEYVRDEVLEAKDWKFAIKRQALGRVAETPPSGYAYAYLMPDDFLRLALGTEDDPSIYPSGYPYKIETMDVIAGIAGIAEFNPTSAYTSAAASKVKIGRYAELNVGSDKKLYVAGEYKQEDITLLQIECVSGVSDSLAVASSGDLITITLANATGAKNTAALIQAALRLLGTVDGIDVSAWTVTQNAAYLASYPTTGVDVDPVPMGNGDKVYQCATNVTGTAANTSFFPGVETTYWTEIAPSAHLCLATDYDNETGNDELILRYIRRVTDPTLFFASFISALAFRLAAEMAIRLTEGATRFKAMMELYYISVRTADEHNQSMDYFSTVDNWTNDKTAQWADAGRSE